jgi:O-antigen ligase
MIDALDLNKRLLLAIAGAALLIGTILLMVPDYYMYVLLFLLVLSLIAIFSKKLRNNMNLVIWSGLMLSVFFGGTRTIEDISQQTVDPIRIIRIVIIVCLFLIVIFNMMFNKFKGMGLSLRSPLGWFLVYAIIAVISSAYSDQFFVSLWKGFEIFVSVVAAMFLLQSLRSFKDVETFWSLNIFFLILLVGSSYLGAIISPSEAFKAIRGVNFKLLEGIYPVINSNSLTQMAAILTAVFVIRYLYYENYKSRVRYLLPVVLVLPALIWSYGRTSILALFFALLVFFIFGRRYRYLLLLVLISLYLFLVDGDSYVKLFLEKGGSLATLSGRLTYWPEAWALFKESPIYGYGFYVASRIIFAERIKVESFSTTDNTYFDVLLSVGIVGFVPFALMLYSFARNLLKSWNSSRNHEFRRLKYEILCVAIIIFFRSLTGPSIQILHWNLPIFLALIICSQSLANLDNSSNSQSS